MKWIDHMWAYMSIDERICMGWVWMDDMFATHAFLKTAELETFRSSQNMVGPNKDLLFEDMQNMLALQFQIVVSWKDL